MKKLFEQPLVSVIIPAYNEEKTIGLCLASLVNQKTQYLFEVIVVENGSTDKTVKKVKAFNASLRLRLVQEKIKGRSPARRRGFAKARGDIIFSTDADAIVPPLWIETMVGALKHSGAVAVTGTWRIEDATPLVNYFLTVVQPITMHIYRLMFGHYWLSGFNFAIWNSAYNRSGGFNAWLNMQEDVELAMRVHKLGKIVFVGNIPVTASGRRFRSGIIAGFFSYVTTFIQVFWFKRTDAILCDVR